MSMRILAAAALLAASTSLAAAQQAGPEPQTMPDQAMPEAHTPSPDRHMGQRHMGKRHFGWHHMHRHEGKGFTLRLGRGNRLKVDCGDEPLKSCIDAARPLIDRLAGDAGTLPSPDGTTGAIQSPPDPSQSPVAPSDDLHYHQAPPSPALPSNTEG